MSNDGERKKCPDVTVTQKERRQLVHLLELGFPCLCLLSWKMVANKKKILTFSEIDTVFGCLLLAFGYYPCFHFDMPESNQRLIRLAQIARFRVQYRAAGYDAMFFPHLCWSIGDVKRNLCEIIN